MARRRLELLSAELAGVRPGPAVPPVTGGSADPGEPFRHPAADLRRARDGAPDDDRPGRHARRSVGAVATVGGWVHDRLPATLQGRVQLGATHLTVVAVAVALALGVTAWWVARADGAATTVPAPARPTGPPSALVTPVSDAGATGGTAASAGPSGAAPAGPSAASVIVVDVTGKVRRPGIATLPAGSRVVDAIEAAGGARRGVSLGSLNLARVLSDGEQVVVGQAAPAGVAASAATAPQGGAASAPMVNINTAAQSELEQLPGVGPVTAQAILRWRTDNGPFTAVDDLLDVSGIGDATLAEMAPFVTL